MTRMTATTTKPRMSWTSASLLLLTTISWFQFLRKGTCLLASATDVVPKTQQHSSWAPSQIEVAEHASFTVENNRFVLDGQPIVLRSGSLHYFRIPPSLWEDRIMRMKSMGLNAISVYIAWNFHELDFDGHLINFSGPRDIAHFLSLAKKHDMMVLLRPGPYICAEWDFGGLPARLLKTRDDGSTMKLRTYDEDYIKEVEHWFDILLPKFVPFLVGNGGPIVMVQVENEYGSYGNVATQPSDKKYFDYLVALVQKHLGEKVVLYTTDGGSLSYMQAGSLSDASIVTLGDFGPFDASQTDHNPARQSIEAQDKMNPSGLSPPMCTEFYTGWLTHWGEKAACTSSKTLAASLHYLLSSDISVNLYMAHGGTNFGYWSGANGGEKQVYFDVTSYDYNAPISEDGGHNLGSDLVDKYNAVRDVMAEYAEEELPKEPPILLMSTFGNRAITKRSRLSLVSWIKEQFSNSTVASENTLRMEDVKQRFGFLLYSTTILMDEVGVLDLKVVKDRAQVYFDGKWIKTVERTDSSYLVPLPKPTSSSSCNTTPGCTLDILVENMGRINYGQGMDDPKGLVAGVSLNGQTIWKWLHYPVELTPTQVHNLVDMVPLEEYHDVQSTDDSSDDEYEEDSHSLFYQTSFNIPETDLRQVNVNGTYLDMSQFSKGYVWVNNYNLGRFWTEKGTQLTLFCPGTYLNLQGENEVVVLDLDAGMKEKDVKGQLGVNFVSRPKFQLPSSLEIRDIEFWVDTGVGMQQQVERHKRQNSFKDYGLGSFWV